LIKYEQNFRRNREMNKSFDVNRVNKNKENRRKQKIIREYRM